MALSSEQFLQQMYSKKRAALRFYRVHVREE